MKEPSKRVKKVIIFLFLLLLVVAILIFGFYKKESSTREDLLIRFETTDIIEFTNHLPISDAVGRKYSDSKGGDESEGYVRFSIQNRSSRKRKYQILLTEQVVSEKKIKENFIKCYLTDENDRAISGFDKNRVPTFYDFSDYEGRTNSKVIYSGSIEGNITIQYRLRMWLSDNYALSKNLETFRVDVDIEEK